MASVRGVVRADLRRLGDRAHHHGDDRQRLGVALEQALAHGGLPEQHAERPDVRAPVKSLRRTATATGDMYATLPLSSPVAVRIPGRMSRPRDAEVQHFGHAAVDTNRFCGDTSRCTTSAGAPSTVRSSCAACSPYAASATMRVAISTGRPRCFHALRHTSLSDSPCMYSMAKKYVPSLGLAEVEHGAHVRVIDPRGELRFVHEHLHEGRVRGHVRVNGLDRHPLVKAPGRRQPPEKHRRHAAVRHEVVQHVAPPTGADPRRQRRPIRQRVTS